MEEDALAAFYLDRGGDHLAVPVEQFRSVGLVVDVDGDGLTLFEAQERAGELAVVGGEGEDAVGGDLDRRGCDGEGVVGSGCLFRGGGCEDAGTGEESSTGEGHGSAEERAAGELEDRMDLLVQTSEWVEYIEAMSRFTLIASRLERVRRIG